MDFEQAKAFWETLLGTTCPTCHGWAKAGVDICPAHDCHNGEALTALGEALVEWIGDFVHRFAEKDHGHYIGTRES